MAKSILTSLTSQLSELKRKHLVVVLAVAIGILSGCFAVFLKWSVSSIRELLTSGSMTKTLGGLYVFYPLIGILIAVFIVNKVLKRRLYSGIPSVLYSISKKRSNVKTHNLYSSLFTSIFTAGFGGSAGLEGPLVQTNAAWGSNLGRLFKVDYKTKTLLKPPTCKMNERFFEVFQAIFGLAQRIRPSKFYRIFWLHNGCF